MDSFVTKVSAPASSGKRDATQANRSDYVLSTSAKAKRAFVPPGGSASQQNGSGVLGRMVSSSSGATCGPSLPLSLTQPLPYYRGATEINARLFTGVPTGVSGKGNFCSDFLLALFSKSPPLSSASTPNHPDRPSSEVGGIFFVLAELFATSPRLTVLVFEISAVNTL